MDDTTVTVQHLTAEDVAVRLRIPRWSIYELAKSRELPHFKIGPALRSDKPSVKVRLISSWWYVILLEYRAVPARRAWPQSAIDFCMNVPRRFT